MLLLCTQPESTALVTDARIRCMYATTYTTSTWYGDTLALLQQPATYTVRVFTVVLFYSSATLLYPRLDDDDDPGLDVVVAFPIASKTDKLLYGARSRTAADVAFNSTLVILLLCVCL